jgi:hypothetical protein
MNCQTQYLLLPNSIARILFLLDTSGFEPRISQ